MKILQINVVCGVKSTGRITTDIAALAEEKGYDCKVGYGRETVPESLQKYAVKIGNPFSNKCHAVCTRALSLTGFASKRATKKFIKWVKEYDPDVVHLHNLHGSYIHVGVLFDYLKKANKKVVWTLHDCWSFTGYCPHFSYTGCQQWLTGCENCPQKCSYKTVWVNKASRNYALKKKTFTGVKDMTLVAPSKWLADLAKQSFLKEYPTEVIYNGIDLDKFRATDSDYREKYGLLDKKVVLGAATGWGEKKGLQDFYRLSQLLDDEYQVVLIGLSQEQIASAPNNVLVLPLTNSVEELAKWYTLADVFVNCTYEDTYPTVNLEAQACDTPVVTYDTDGCIEGVPEGNVAKQGDVAALKEKIAEVIENPVCLPKQRFDKNDSYMRYLQLYGQGEER